MASLLGPGLFCNACLCNCCFSGISKCTSQKDHKARIFGYLVLFVVYYGVGALLMYTFSSTFMQWFEKWIKCPKFGEESCFGASLILRVSLALAILYLLLFFAMLFKDDFSYKINKNCWIFKYLLPLGLTVGFFFIGNGFFKVYAQISLYGGILYLILQDLAFNEYFIRFSNGAVAKSAKNGCYTIVYWFLVLLFLAVTILLIALSFKYNYGCSSGKGISITATILVVINYLLTLLRTRNDVNILSTSIYNAYIVYYLYSGLSSDGAPGCSKLITSATWTLSEILINLFMIIVVFSLMTFSVEMPVFQIKSATEADVTPEFYSRPEIRDSTHQHESNALRNNESTQDAVDHLEYRTMKFIWLFLCYIFLTMHFLSVLTNFGTVSIYKGESWSLYSSQTGFYLKVVNGFFSEAIFLWMVLVPLILRDRQFGYPEDDNPENQHIRVPGAVKKTIADSTA